MAIAVHAMASHRVSSQAEHAERRTGRSRPLVRRSQRGAALLFALAAVLIIALLVFGVSFSATQDYTLAHTQMDAATALNTAEAGLTWEAVQLSPLQYDSSRSPDVGAAPYGGPPRTHATAGP